MDLIAAAVLKVLGEPVIRLIVKHWREIFNWVKRIFEGIKEIFMTIGAGLYYALSAYVELLTADLAAFRNKVLYPENDYYVEEIRERRIDAGLLPDWARRNAVLGQENEVTNDVRRELRLEH